MNCREDVKMLLEELSQRVLQNLPVAAWRKLFIDRQPDSVRFERAAAHLLCVDSAGPWGSDPDATELALLAGDHGGEPDPCPLPYRLVAFDDAAGALRMAMAMQARAPESGLKLGIISCICSQALIRYHGRTLRIWVGEQVARAAEVARDAAAGSVRLAPEVCPGLQHELSRLTCLVTSEFDGDELAGSTVIPLPSATAQLSTFAGLGR